MDKIIVTGAAGFIGSYVCQELLNQGYKVTGIDNMCDNYDPVLKEYRLQKLLTQDNFDFMRGDIREYGFLTDIFDLTPYDAVIHLGGMPGVRLSVEDPWLFLDINSKGTLNLLEECRHHDVKKFIFASTSSVYGENAPFPTPETAGTGCPLSPYAASKIGAEAMCHVYHYLYDIDVTVFRYFTVYGPASRPDMAMLRFIKWISEGSMVRINGDGNQTRGFTYVDDIASGTIKGLKKVGFEIMNLGGHESISINDLISILEKKIGKTAKVEYLPMFKADMRANLADITKACSLLDWKPTVSLDEGLQRTVDWYKQEEDWLQNLKI